ncbi:N-acetylornithine carbamoyltransferase [Chondrinema litorale]|uniref:N-acetylornithine carbamoyltransferase n=1 Tax=Chondrinema litorale TaxID=2994555 RepID=UPI0025438CAD|nr:N-acetylornithine carbamoyltransferase [Chondrinema litorale]UZR94038.1 N-acetylornithine carbamoyltransferase [Chondrinema litorale]
MRHFTSVEDVNDIEKLIEIALNLKAVPKASEHLGKGKTMGIIFLNPSLRTRLSTQVAAQNLGMSPIVMNFSSDGWQLEFADGVVMDGNKAEHVKEAAAVMGTYFDVMGIRSFPGLKDKDEDYQDNVINQIKKYAGIPVISLESAIRHPLQSLADLITITEHKKVAKPKIVLSWAPHPRALPQAVSNSFAEWVLAAGYDLTITHPEGYELSEQFTKGATIEYDQKKAFEGADFIYTKNWSSFKDYGQVLNSDPSWQIDAAKMKLTNDAKFMHCLPVRRNVIVSDDVLDSESSIVIKQAENRIYSAQAVIEQILKANF